MSMEALRNIADGLLLVAVVVLAAKLLAARLYIRLLVLQMEAQKRALTAPPDSAAREGRALTYRANLLRRVPEKGARS